MKIEKIEVGETIGIRNNNPNSLKYYLYTTAVINEVTETTFKASPYGDFHRDTGKAVRTTFEAVTLEEVRTNNFEYHLVQACENLSERIPRKVSKLGQSPEDRAVLEQVDQLLEARIKEIEKARAENEAAEAEQPATAQ